MNAAPTNRTVMAMSNAEGDTPSNLQAEQARKQMEDGETMTDGRTKDDLDLGEQDIAHLGGSEYRVLSFRNDSVTSYRVDVDAGECTCPDEDYNTEGAEVCAHLAKAIMAHTSQYDAESWAARDMQTMVDRAQNLTRKLQDTVDWTETVLQSEATAAAAETARETGEADDVTDDTPDNEAAQEAAEKLEQAFEDAEIPDMQVQAHAGYVWMQTGQDTPEDWPYPGGSDTFSVLFQNADQVEYVYEADDDYDAHELYDEKPGEWWKNAIAPEDVVDYINEVLG
jgi:hypothetical protein